MATDGGSKKVSRDAYLKRMAVQKPAPADPVTEPSESAAPVEASVPRSRAPSLVEREDLPGAVEDPGDTAVRSRARKSSPVKAAPTSRTKPKAPTSTRAMSSKPAEKTSPQGRTAEKAPVEEPVPDLPSAPAPAGFGQGSDLLEAMEIRIDSLSVALHRLEARHASVERMLERMTGLSPTEVSEDQAVPRLDETSTKTSAGLPASPRPTTPRPISPRRGRGWIALAVGLLLGALAALVATYIGVGTEAQLSIDEIFSASSPPIDFRSLLSSVTWMSAAVGLGVAFLVFLLTIAIRRGPAR